MWNSPQLMLAEIAVYLSGNVYEPFEADAAVVSVFL